MGWKAPENSDNEANNRRIAALIERAQEGDTASFEALVREFLPQLRRFAKGFSTLDADDVAQEALIKAYRSIRAYRFDSSFRTWLFRITRNACIDAERKRRSHKAKEEALRGEHTNLEHSHTKLPDQELLARERQAQLWLHIRALPKRFRVPLILCDIEGLSYQEAADIERIPVGTARSRLARARAKLRVLLEQAKEQDPP